MIYKRGCVYYYRFWLDGKLYVRSTHQGDKDEAGRQQDRLRRRLKDERADREDAAQRLGCRPEQVVRCAYCRDWFHQAQAVVADGLSYCSDRCRLEWVKRRRIVPTLREFLDGRFEPWAKATFETACLKNWLWYRTGIRALLKYKPLADRRLDEITGELVSEFGSYRLLGRQISSVNSSLRVLRSVVHRAAEWGVLDRAPKFKLLGGERHRERVVSPEEEAKYLAAAPEPLASVATVLADTGMRPEECFSLVWEAITWVNGRHGSLRVTEGKTPAARRMLPMTPRVRRILEARWEAAGKPQEGWIWPAATRSGHIEPSSLRKQHAKAFKTLKDNETPVRPFVLYSLRHTFLTRLGMSGCDVWTLARIAGHSSLSITKRYVHSSDEDVLAALDRFAGRAPTVNRIVSTSDTALSGSADCKLLTGV